MVARRAGPGDPAAQGARLLARQLRQVPRWLQQTRYNGPPPLKQPRGSIATASNYSNNAALAGDGHAIVWEGYEAKLPLAKARGEIGVEAGTVAGAAPGTVTGDTRHTPRSAYNPAVSADGRFVAFESAEGNLNFAKRYGQMRVYVSDRKTGRTQLASLGISSPTTTTRPTTRRCRPTAASSPTRRASPSTARSRLGERPAHAARAADPRAATPTESSTSPRSPPTGATSPSPRSSAERAVGGLPARPPQPASRNRSPIPPAASRGSRS